MEKDINTIISLVSAVVSLASFFGLFYKMKYQLEQMEKKQDKFLDRLEDAIDTTYKNKEDITALKIQQAEMKEDIRELKGANNEKRGQYDARTS